MQRRRTITVGLSVYENPRKQTKYTLTPLQRSDHVTVEIVLQEETVLHRNEQFRNWIQNYAKTNFAELNKFYGKINWKELFEGELVQENIRYF